MKQYLIWSNEHRAWWSPNYLGYVTDIALAGIYSLEDAINICDRATLDWHKVPNELPVAVEDLPGDAKIALVVF